MAKYDVTIIGSGLGGLLCGYILSKEGRSVLLLEQGRQIGGCLQSFTREGRTFDTGVHYIGSYDQGQNLRRYFNYFDLSGNIQMQRMDESGFDRMVYYDDEQNEYPHAMGYERFIDQLSGFFPAERNALAGYCDKLQEICRQFPLYNLEAPSKDIIETDYFTQNAQAFINSMTSDARLRSVLSGQNPLYAGEAEKTPLYVHALITNSFIQSAWRPIGGSAQIAESLSASIRRFGGKIETNSKVVRLEAPSDNIERLVLEDGRQIESGIVVSTIHPQTTLGMLIGGRYRPSYKQRIMGLENTRSAFMLFLCMKPGTYRYRNYNYYCYKDENVWNTFDYQDAEWPKSCFIFTPCPAASPVYADAVIVSAYMNFSEVRAWEHTTVGRRGAAYEAFKRRKAEQLIDFVRRRFPEIKHNIQSYYTATPLTLRDYTGTPEGSLYGVVRSSADPIKTLIPPKTKIPNLYFTGQNIVLHGVLGVTIAAVLTCSKILGSENLLDKIRRAT